MEPILSELFERLQEERQRIDLCLRKLTEDEIWQRPREESNSIGNLCLHLAGNESHYLGHCVGGTDYVRDRPGEFNAEGGRSTEELSQGLAAARESTRRVFESLTAADLDRIVDSDHPPNPTARRLIFHVTHHYAYHTGQIIVLTRLAQEVPGRILQWGH